MDTKKPLIRTAKDLSQSQIRNGPFDFKDQSMYKVVNIIPATDWYAVYIQYVDDTSVEDTFIYFTQPLVAWAYVQYEDGSMHLEGIVTDDQGYPRLLWCEEFEDFFYGYHHKSELPTNDTMVRSFVEDCWQKADATDVCKQYKLIIR